MNGLSLAIVTDYESQNIYQKATIYLSIKESNSYFKLSVTQLNTSVENLQTNSK